MDRILGPIKTKLDRIDIRSAKVVSFEILYLQNSDRNQRSTSSTTALLGVEMMLCMMWYHCLKDPILRHHQYVCPAL
jgi:hypothetical protein